MEREGGQGRECVTIAVMRPSSTKSQSLTEKRRLEFPEQMSKTLLASLLLIPLTPE